MAESNRDKLIRASAGLFLQNGFHGTSLDDILDDTGVAKSNFYYHFKSKDDLALAVALYWTAWMDESIFEPTLGDAARGPWQRLENMFERAAASQEKGPIDAGSPLGGLASELASAMPEVRQCLQEYFVGLEERIAGVLAQAEDTWMDDGQARAIAGTIVATLEGGLLVGGLRQDGNEVRISGLVLVALIRNAWRG